MMGMEEYIGSLMEKHDLSLTGLAERLGYKSKTSINRIINGTAKPESIRKFEQKVCSAFNLLPEENKQLSAVVQSAIYGRERFITNQAIWEFIQYNGGVPRQTPDVQVSDLYSGKTVSMHARYAEAGNLHLTVLNCQYVSGLFDNIYWLIQQLNAEVRHFIYVNNDDVRTIRAVSSLMPVFYETAYMGYSRRKRPIDQQQDCGLHESDLMIASWVDKKGVAHTDIITFTDWNKGIITEVPPLDQGNLKLLGLDREHYTPIKRNYFECNAFEDYIRYSQDYAELERDHTVWKLKPDVGVDQIPAWILRKAVQEGTASLDDQFMEILDELEAVYRERYRNTITKRKHIYTVFKRGAMHRFAMTGRTTDHFWMMRPFTLDERIVILTEMLKQQIDNPYVHMYFLREDNRVSDVEIAYYEGEGMLILNAGTDYNLEQGHSEVIITHEKMLTLFKDFFMGELLQEHVFPESYTCEYLRHLIFEVEDLASRSR